LTRHAGVSGDDRGQTSTRANPGFDRRDRRTRIAAKAMTVEAVIENAADLKRIMASVVRSIGGRLESHYRYFIGLVCNPLPCSSIRQSLF